MNNRRDFLKLSGLASLGLAGGSTFTGFAAESTAGKSQAPRFNMSGFAAPKIEKVRIGIIGLGNRGPSHLETMKLIEGVEVRASATCGPNEFRPPTNGSKARSISRRFIPAIRTNG